MSGTSYPPTDLEEPPLTTPPDNGDSRMSASSVSPPNTPPTAAAFIAADSPPPSQDPLREKQQQQFPSGADIKLTTAEEDASGKAVRNTQEYLGMGWEKDCLGLEALAADGGFSLQALKDPYDESRMYAK